MVVNLHIYPSSFRFESRILKETKSIIKLGLATQVIILSSHEKGQPRLEEVTRAITVYRLKLLSDKFGYGKVSKMLGYVEFYFRAFYFTWRRELHIINCHSLMLLPLSVVIKKIKKAKLIYDPHELETERLGLHGLAKTVSKWVEKYFIYSSDAVIVVSGLIQKWYRETYGLSNVFLVRNIPNRFSLSKSNILRENFSIADEAMIFIYQGLIDEGRSIDLYLKVFAGLPTHHLIIMGYGSLEGKVKDFSLQFPNIHFQPAVKPDQLMHYTSSADIGLSLIENCCLSYYYSLPNKFFEYTLSDVPMIVSNFPEIVQYVKKYNIGWSVELNEVKLKEVIVSISQAELKLKRTNLMSLKDRFSWENEEATLVEVFEEIKLKSRNK